MLTDMAYLYYDTQSFLQMNYGRGRDYRGVLDTSSGSKSAYDSARADKRGVVGDVSAEFGIHLMPDDGVLSAEDQA